MAKNNEWLKPCPFCGEDAAYITRNECLHNNFISYSLHHTANGCVLSSWDRDGVFDSEAEAAECWNRRRY